MAGIPDALTEESIQALGFIDLDDYYRCIQTFKPPEKFVKDAGVSSSYQTWLNYDGTKKGLLELDPGLIRVYARSSLVCLLIREVDNSFVCKIGYTSNEAEDLIYTASKDFHELFQVDSQLEVCCRKHASEIALEIRRSLAKFRQFPAPHGFPSSSRPSSNRFILDPEQLEGLRRLFHSLMRGDSNFICRKQLVENKSNEV